MLSECHRKSSLFLYDRVTPLTPKASKGYVASQSPLTRLLSNPSGSTLTHVRVKLKNHLFHALRARWFLTSSTSAWSARHKNILFLCARLGRYCRTLFEGPGPSAINEKRHHKGVFFRLEREKGMLAHKTPCLRKVAV